jgi:hypothetical protein
MSQSIMVISSKEGSCEDRAGFKSVIILVLQIKDSKQAIESRAMRERSTCESDLTILFIGV